MADTTDHGEVVNFHFRTIGLGTINYRKAAKRLAREATGSGLFKTSYGRDETYLMNYCGPFWYSHRTVLKARVPGFGWWIWKPAYIASELKSIPTGDILMYVDAGSYIGQSQSDIQEIRRYLQAAMIDDVVGSSNQPFIEERYSAREYLDYIQLGESARKSNQFYAGFLIVKNSVRGEALLQDWQDLSCMSNHRFFFNPPNREREVPDFVHHMYDQAVLSPLLKKYSARDVRVGDKSIQAPIRMLRHRYSYKVGEKNLSIIIYFQIIAFFSKLKLAFLRRLFRNSLNLRPGQHL